MLKIILIISVDSAVRVNDYDVVPCVKGCHNQIWHNIYMIYRQTSRHSKEVL